MWEDLRFFSFVSGGGLLVEGFGRLELLVYFAVCYGCVVVVVVFIFAIVAVVVVCLFGMSEVGVALVERPSAHNVLAGLMALEVCLLPLAELVDVH